MMQRAPMLVREGVVTVDLGRGGLVAIADAADYDLLAPYLWHPSRGGGHHPGCWYAKAYIEKRDDGRSFSAKMHRWLLGVTDPAVHVDHINGDGLDNRRANLRLATPRQNVANSVSRRGASRFKGVAPAPGGKWRGVAVFDKRQVHLGCYATEEQAALAYNIAALLLNGAHARLNDLPPTAVLPDDRRAELIDRMSRRMRGERYSGMSIERAEQIREAVRAGATQVEAGRRFGVSGPMVCNIVNGKRWTVPA